MANICLVRMCKEIKGTSNIASGLVINNNPLPHESEKTIRVLLIYKHGLEISICKHCGCLFLA